MSTSVSRFPLRRRPARGLAVVALALVAACSAARSASRTRSPVAEQRAEALFARHCAACHGVRGGADSAIAEFLRPRPRSFALGSFNLVSTTNGVPTADDLLHTLQRGLPGSTMPAFSWLPEDDLRLLARHVRDLAIAGSVVAQEARALAAGRAFDAQRAEALAVRAMTPGDEIAVPDPIAIDDAVLARGRGVFVERCAACHGIDGKGFGEAPSWSERAEFAWSRDLTAGVLKGGAGHRELFFRIVGGMPAVGMPPTPLPEADATALVAFVQSLLPAGAGDLLVQRRLQFTASRVAGPLPDDPDDPRWRTTEVVLAPLQAHAKAIRAVAIAFVHDGEHVAVLMRWRDPSRDSVPIGPFPDAAALQLTEDHDPPAIAMGAPRQPVHIWHWQAFRPGDLAGDLDALAPRPDGSRADVPLQPRPAAFEAPADLALHAHGLGAGNLRPFRDASVELAVQPRWREGEWSLVVRRPLRGRTGDDLDLLPGRRVHFACALWNGAAGDAGARKSISVWHRLELAP